MTTPVSSKKPKTSSDNDDFETVKRYLLECPHVTQDHPAIRAALEGIDREQKRNERDAKLKLKFANSSSAAAASPTPSDDLVVVGSTSTTSETSKKHHHHQGDDDAAAVVVIGEDMMESEWQDLANSDTKKGDDDGTSFFGRELAKVSIDAISENQVRVKTPVEAIAVVFHASLRSDLLGFACTGIPEDETSSNNGFAAPVRELPKSQFLPPKWNSFSQVIKLRYRKNGTGAIKLIVQELLEEQKIQVQLYPGKEPPSQSLLFQIDDHINLDSWNAALKQGKSVQPALHYKFLSTLLTKFCQAFDLGSVGDDAAQESHYMDNTISTQMNHRPIFKSDLVSPQPVPPVGSSSSQRKPWDNGAPATLDQAFPLHARTNGGGDFADDLAPGGLRDPRFLPVGGGRMGGNLMGPNHPGFMNGHPAMGGPPMGGPGTMQPRFDPMYPPGAVDIDINGNPRRSGRPSRSGQPNPDHLPPPNSFGDMFS